MKKREYSCEELSEIFDNVCSEGGILRSMHPEMCENSYKDYVQLEKTIQLLHSLGELKVPDRFFASRVLACCCQKRNRRFRIIQQYILPSLAAASFLLVISFGIYNGNIRFPRKDVPSAQHYEIVLEEPLASGKLKNLISANNGLVIKNEDGVLFVRSTMTDYLQIKRQLTLTEEEKVFSGQNESMLMTGTGARSYSSPYMDEIVTFRVVIAKNE